MFSDYVKNISFSLHLSGYALHSILAKFSIIWGNGSLLSRNKLGDDYFTCVSGNNSYFMKKKLMAILFLTPMIQASLITSLTIKISRHFHMAF